MGRQNKNKKAEIKARRKTRKANERIRDLKMREKRAKAIINQMMLSQSEALKSLDVGATEASSSQDDQSTPLPSE